MSDLTSRNAVKLYQATLNMLQQELKTVGYPMPVNSEADLAAIVSRAYLRGAAFVAEACNLDGSQYVAKSALIMHEHAKRRGGGSGQLIMPGDKEFVH